jgi:putative redox protein
MGAQISAQLHFEKGFKGTLRLREGEIGIGIEPNEARPYDMLQGALAACLHSTFLDILEKKRLTLDFADYEISGEKRDDVPTTLKTVTVNVTLPAGENELAYRKSMELATKYCSVYNTLSHVAEMTLVLNFR